MGDFVVKFGVECGNGDYRNKILKKEINNEDIPRIKYFLLANLFETEE